MTKTITAIIMGIAGFAAIWWLPQGWFNWLVMGIVAAALIEYAWMFFQERYERWGVIAGGVGLAATMLFCPEAEEAAPISLVLILFGLAAFFMWRVREMPHVAERLGLALLGVIYIGLTIPFWGWLHGVDMGREFVLLAAVPACLCDIFAFIAGRALGKRKLAPLVSPNKTVEGFVGALIGAALGTAIVKLLLLQFISWQMVFIFSVIIWMTSPIGDLIESMLKRSVNLKDSGNIIPGHGGILDRFDALIFTGPAAYVFVKYL